MTPQFEQIQMTRPRSNMMDLTHDVKLSFNMGELIPVCCLEGIPGDKFHINVQSLVRFAPLIAPLMHRLDISIHYFFVPYRLLWKNWETYITGDFKPGIGTAPVMPYGLFGNAAINQCASGDLADYLGIPFTASGAPGATEKINAMPFAAYQKIYNDYYRDQNLIADAFPNHTYPFASDGNQGNLGMLGFLTKQKRAWEHDYFTAALPFAQKGTAVAIPLGDVVLKAGAQQQLVRQGAPGHTLIPSQTGFTSDAASIFKAQPTGFDAVLDPNGSLSVGATQINDLRRAYAIQRWLENNARGGTRYIESMKVHFGVTSDDARLQRPEYICGMRSPIVISEIVNTGGDQATLPQGNMAGHALGAASGNAGSYYCKEHGYIMGIASILPKTAYQQGIPKHFLKTTDQYDYFWPELAHLGEQAVLNAEIYAYQTAPANTNTFGYVPRYAEYKYEPNRVCGDFRGNLNYWHLSRIFSSAPSLNQQFVECVPDTRIFAVTDPAAQKMYAHVLNQIKVRRLMPIFGTPNP